MSRHETAFLPDPEAEELLAAARLAHSRRSLERALHHGVALLAALRLPRLAEDDFDSFDTAAVDFAVREGIKVLDALDAPGEDLEPSLGWKGRDPGALLDGEVDDSDLEDDDPGEDDGTAEPSLGAPEMHDNVVTRIDGRWCVMAPDQARWATGGDDDREWDIADVPHDDEGEAEDTAPERHGRGFTRCGADDIEDGDEDEDWRGDLQQRRLVMHRGLRRQLELA